MQVAFPGRLRSRGSMQGPLVSKVSSHCHETNLSIVEKERLLEQNLFKEYLFTESNEWEENVI